MLLAAWIVGGFILFLRLDIEAYPDPSPPLVEVITQNPSWSAEEMEQQVTVPVETALFGIPHLEEVRSISIFGLSDVKMYFSYGSDYYWDRQEVLNRLQLIHASRRTFSRSSRPESPVGEIYRYQLYGPAYSLNELKATQDWFVTREIKQVSGIIDVTVIRRQHARSTSPKSIRASFCNSTSRSRRLSPPSARAMPTQAETTSRWAAKTSTFAASGSSTTFRK